VLSQVLAPEEDQQPDDAIGYDDYGQEVIYGVDDYVDVDAANQSFIEHNV
jgi:hypothetical protein